MERWTVRATSGAADVSWQVSAGTPLDALRQACRDAESDTVAGARLSVVRQPRVHLGMGSDGDGAEIPVVIVTAEDPDGPQLRLSYEAAISLLADVAAACRQLTP